MQQYTTCQTKTTTSHLALQKDGGLMKEARHHIGRSWWYMDVHSDFEWRGGVTKNVRHHNNTTTPPHKNKEHHTTPHKNK